MTTHGHAEATAQRDRGQLGHGEGSREEKTTEEDGEEELAAFDVVSWLLEMTERLDDEQRKIRVRGMLSELLGMTKHLDVDERDVLLIRMMMEIDEEGAWGWGKYEDGSPFDDIGDLAVDELRMVARDALERDEEAASSTWGGAGRAGYDRSAHLFDEPSFSTAGGTSSWSFMPLTLGLLAVGWMVLFWRTNAGERDKKEAAAPPLRRVASNKAKNGKSKPKNGRKVGSRGKGAK